MQPEHSYSTLANIKRITSKELTLFFASPVAYLFLAAFAAVTLFVFFWGESFFARNIADVRPLFEWMPLLLIFLASTLTMRLWSEERRTGTLEHVLTQPAPLWHFIMGKFLACLVLLTIALVITLPLPITIALMGDLDWGPVWAGYLATFLLGAAYLSIGLFVSARSDNSIVSLIGAVALCGLFYLVGTPTITDFFGNNGGELLRRLGTGSRFDAITRGVIDFRDLYYYLSIIVVFLVLNNYTLKKERWATPGDTVTHRNWQIVTILLLANALGANLWLGQVTSLRLDATRGNQYSISSATEGYLARLQEPLLVRGYFSAKTHPLLAPLVPQLRDLIKEYDIAGDGKVRVEFVDPALDPELEQEANQRFGIQPVPFQVADRYQSSIVSSYFNVLVQYGDQYQVLSFNDLIEIKAQSETDVDVQLRNPEHDLTRAIKKVLNSYQAGGNLFDTVQGDITFNAYVSADAALPESLVAFKQSLLDSVEALQQDAKGRLSVNVVDPAANGGIIGQQIAEAYGFQPMPISLLSNETFYFYLTLENGEQLVQIPIDDLSQGGFERNLEASIKRLAAGFTKTVALVLPTQPAPNPYGMPSPRGPSFSQLEAFLGADLNVQQEDLSDGRVAGDADILLLMAPKELNDKQLFAVDQFLMQGGTVIAATSPFGVDFSNRTMTMAPQRSGLEPWLAHHGISIEQQLVMDPMNAAFPIPVNRDVGGFQIQEIRMLDYPYFVDVRSDGMNQDNPITADIPQATISWASPIVIDPDQQGERDITELLHSSDDAWLSTSTNILPVDARGILEFTPEGKQRSQVLGVISAGRFASWFKGKPSPLLTQQEAADQAPAAPAGAEDSTAAEPPAPVVAGVIERSPESSRIIVFSSNSFLRDQIIQLTGSASGSEYLNTLQLMANTIDWSLEDAGLLGIRARSHFNRTLPPMDHGTQLFWEYLNYILAAIGLGAVALVQRRRHHAKQQQYLQLLATNA